MRILCALLVGIFIVSAVQADAMMTFSDDGLKVPYEKREMCVPLDQARMPFLFF